MSVKEDPAVSVKIWTTATVVAGMLVMPSSATAAPPVLLTVAHQNRHSVATFSAPRADSVTVYIATRPDRATDGSFLSENIEEIDFLTDSEIQSGRWFHEDKIDPGRYWVMLRASPDFTSCWDYDRFGGIDPACADGHSNLLTLDVPKPGTRYAARVAAYRYLRQATLTLTATPLGEDRSYRVCYRTAAKRRRCVSGTLDGYSWDAAATDTLDVSTRGLATYTTFTWFVDGRAVVSRRARVRL